MSFCNKFGVNLDEDDDWLSSCEIPIDFDSAPSSSTAVAEAKLEQKQETVNLDRFRYKEKSTSSANDAKPNIFTSSSVTRNTIQSQSPKTCSAKSIFELNNADKPSKLPHRIAEDSQSQKPEEKHVLPKGLDVFFEDDCEENNSPSTGQNQRKDIRPSPSLRNNSSPNIARVLNETPSKSPVASSVTRKVQDLHPNNKKATVNSVNTTRHRKRKFPGPAGLLPELPADGMIPLQMCADGSVLPSREKSLFGEGSQLSQPNLEDFQKEPWQTMLKDLESKGNLRQSYYCDIKTMLQKASRKSLPKHVVAQVLCVLIVELSYNNSKDIEDATAVFKDETGEISGKVRSFLIENYREYLVPGAALVLKQVSMLFDQLVVRRTNLISVYGDNGKMVSINKWEFPVSPSNNQSENTSTVTNESNSMDDVWDDDLFGNEDEFTELFDSIDESSCATENV